MKTQFFNWTNALLDEVQYALHKPGIRKILFDHLPKCGGSTLRAHLRMQYPKRKVYLVDDLNMEKSLAQFQAMPRDKRFKYDLILGHRAHDLLAFVDPECLKVTMFREPVERMVSYYFFVKRNPKHYLHAILASSPMQLQEFAASGLTAELENWYTSHFSSMTSEEVKQHPDEALNKAFYVVSKQYDIVGFLDDYSGFIQQVERQANLRYTYEGEKRNVTQERPAIEDIPLSAIETIKEANQLDLALYEKLRKSMTISNEP